MGGARAREGGRRLGGPDEALPDPLPHRRRPGRRVCRPGQPGGGPLGVAHVRHHQGWRLPGGPGRGRGARPRGHRDGDRARAHGPAVQPDRRRADRPAPLRRPYPQLRRGTGQARVLRGRPHRPHDPADPLPAVPQARRQVLRRVPRRRPRDRGRRARRRRARRGGRRVPDRRRRPRRPALEGGPARDRRLRPDVPGHVQRVEPDGRRRLAGLPPRRADGGHGVLPVPSRRASSGSGSSSPRPRAARAAPCSTTSASGS